MITGQRLQTATTLVDDIGPKTASRGDAALRRDADACDDNCFPAVMPSTSTRSTLLPTRIDRGLRNRAYRIVHCASGGLGSRLMGVAMHVFTWDVGSGRRELGGTSQAIGSIGIPGESTTHHALQGAWPAAGGL